MQCDSKIFRIINNYVGKHREISFDDIACCVSSCKGHADQRKCVSGLLVVAIEYGKVDPVVVGPTCTLGYREREASRLISWPRLSDETTILIMPGAIPEPYSLSMKGSCLV